MTSGNDALGLNGSWELVTGERGGWVLPEASVWRARMVVEAGVFRLRAGRDALRGAFLPAQGSVPGRVDAVVDDGPQRGTILRGLYEVSGCRLRACFAAPGGPRPADLAGGDLLLVWEAATELVRPSRSRFNWKPNYPLRPADFSSPPPSA